jgi:hypothetical protein
LTSASRILELDNREERKNCGKEKSEIDQSKKMKSMRGCLENKDKYFKK